MTTILSIAYIVLFLMMVFVIGLYCMNTRCIEDMKKTIHFLVNENVEVRAKLRVCEKRFMQLQKKPEKVVFVSDRKDDDIKFGGEGI